MDVKKLQAFCRELPGATHDIKWEDHLVFSVGAKMFASFNVDGGVPLGLKVSDEEFDALTERPGIIPAPYAARFGWVSVTDRKALSDAEARRLARASYDLVLEKLPRRLRDPLRSPAAAGARAKRTGTRSPSP